MGRQGRGRAGAQGQGRIVVNNVVMNVDRTGNEAEDKTRDHEERHETLHKPCPPPATLGPVVNSNCVRPHHAAVEDSLPASSK